MFTKICKRDGPTINIVYLIYGDIFLISVSPYLKRKIVGSMSTSYIYLDISEQLKYQHTHELN